MKKKTLKIFFLFVVFLMLPHFVKAAVIFEDNFDSLPDWNATNQLDGSECSVGMCVGTMPGNWNLYRSVNEVSGLDPSISIQKLPGNLADHTTGNGKAAIIYNESVTTDSTPFPGDGIIGKYFGAGANYPELYIQFWSRTQPNWNFVESGLSKVFRASNWRGTSNIFQWANENTPIMFFDYAIYNGKQNYAPSYRCDQLPYSTNAGDGTLGRSNDYYCGNNDQPTDGVGQVWGGVVPTAGYADTAWHKYEFYLKINDVGSANGVYKFSYDGNVVYDQENVVWNESVFNPAKGWNSIAIGGNSDNKWTATGTNADQWYAIDDVVVSTTPIPANYVIGSDSSDMIAPAAPSGLGVL